MEDVFSQRGYAYRLEWGWRGAKAAAARGDIVIVVDVLRFSTAAAAAAARCGIIYPCVDLSEARIVAERTGAELGRHHRSDEARYSLSPASYADLSAGTKIALPSPNGATCCRIASSGSAVLVGGLVNATAVRAAAVRLRSDLDAEVTLLACGERWSDDDPDGPLRVAAEDYLGAGAILTGLEGLSPEASICAAAFESAQPRIDALIWECGSGLELRAKGSGEDVRFASCLDSLTAVPILRGDRLEPL